MKLKFKRLFEDAYIPTKGTQHASGYDLYARERWHILPGETVLISTGIAFELEAGTEIQVRPRSGLSLKTKLRVANSPGTVDADFRGECCVIIENIGDESYVINKGDRIAQAVLCPIILSELEEVTELNTTVRGYNGFGSTGV